VTTTILREAAQFIDGLPDENSAKIVIQLENLGAGRTETLNMKTLKGKIRELVVDEYRLVFFIISERIYIVDAFRKKSQKTPLRIITRAEKIYRYVREMNK